MFQSRFVGAYDPCQDIHITIKVGPLTGRKLVVLRWDTNLGYGDPEPCRAPFFVFDRTIDAETLRTNWELICVEVLQELFGLFPDIRITQETLLKWIEKYKTRQF